MEAGQELAIEGEPNSQIIIVLRGIFRLFKASDTKEVLVATLAGAGQVIGEMGTITQGAEASLNPYTISAETAGRVVAVPADSFMEVAARYADVELEIKKSFEWREIISRAISLRKSPVTALLHDDEVACLSNVATWVRFEPGEDLGDGNRALWQDCVSAIIVSGSVEACPPAPPDSETRSISALQLQQQQQQQQQQQVHATLDVCAFQEAGVPLEVGAGVEEAFAGDHVVLLSMGRRQVRAGQEGAVICLLQKSDFEVMIEPTNFLVRTWLDMWTAKHGSKKRELAMNKEPRIVRERLPWAKSQEWLLHCAISTRQRGVESFKGEDGGVDVGDDANMGAYFWNRTIPSREIELWHDILSFGTVSVSMSNPLETERAVEGLKSAWKRRFAVATPAGASLESQVLRSFTLERMMECEGNYAAAEMWVAKMEERGLQMDSKMRREMLRMYNSSNPIPVERAFKTIKALVKSSGLRKSLISDTVCCWCSRGHSGKAEEVVSYLLENGIKVHEVAITALMVGRVRERDIAGAHKSLGMMWDRQIVPSITMMNSLVALYVESGMIDRAVEILYEMEASGDDEGPRPNVATYLCVAGGLAAAGDSIRVEEILARMPKENGVSDVVKGNLLIEALCIAGRVDVAEELANDSWRNEETVSMIAAGWSKRGESERAATVIIDLAFQGIDSSKVNLQKVTKRWHLGKRTQVPGFEISLDLDPSQTTLSHGLHGFGRLPSDSSEEGRHCLDDWGRQLEETFSEVGKEDDEDNEEENEGGAIGEDGEGGNSKAITSAIAFLRTASGSFQG